MTQIVTLYLPIFLSGLLLIKCYFAIKDSGRFSPVAPLILLSLIFTFNEVSIVFKSVELFHPFFDVVTLFSYIAVFYASLKMFERSPWIP